MDGGISQRDLYVLRETTAVAGLIELSFHDRLEQAKHIHDNMDLYAQAIVSGLIRACGLIKKQREHWAEESYQKCLANGFVINDRRFDDKLTRGEFLAILSQITR